MQRTRAQRFLLLVELSDCLFERLDLFADIAFVAFRNLDRGRLHHGSRRLGNYLKSALGISAEELSAIMWEFPRPLLTTVLPTAIRRLASDWAAGGKSKQDYRSSNNPLPDFIPGSLFADLNLAEVAIDLSGMSSANLADTHSMTVFAAMREFAPGRVSHRYGVNHRSEHMDSHTDVCRWHKQRISCDHLWRAVRQLRYDAR